METKKVHFQSRKYFSRFHLDFVKGFFNRIYREYYWYDFNAGSFLLFFGLILFVFGFIWGLVKWNQSISTGVPATTGTVLIAVLPIIVAIQFLTQFLVLDIDQIPRKPLSRRKNNSSTREITQKVTANSVK